MLNIVKTTAAAAALLVAFGSAQAFDLGDDVNNCRAMIDENGLVGDAEYTLDFLDDKGNRNRVVTLRANVVGGEDQIIECRMKRSKVLEVVLADAE